SDSIRQIAELVPSVRLFYSIRNPIARAWSSALMALERAEMTIDEASDLWFIGHFKSAGSRQRGDYAACLLRWQGGFSAGQIRVILFDDLVAKPGEMLTGLAEHIGVEPGFFRSVPEIELRKPVFAGPGHVLRPTLRRFLTASYGLQIAALGKVL